MPYPDRFYPVVDSVDWVHRLVALGVGTIQLRVKGLAHVDAVKIVRQALTVRGGARLVVNDYWCAAIEAGAQHVHLGFEDSAEADFAALRRAGLTIGLVEAAGILIKDGFEVFPYCTEDLTVALRLREIGCQVIMPWAAPIGSARGITNRDALKLMRARLPDVMLVVDAGLGAPSHAAEALELGYDAVLLNTAVAKARDPVNMAKAFRHAVDAGRIAYEAGLMGPRDFASPSTPVVGTPFWHAVS